MMVKKASDILQVSDDIIDTRIIIVIIKLLFK